MSAPPRVIYIDKFSVVDCLKDIGGDWEYILKSDYDELQAKLTESQRVANRAERLLAKLRLSVGLCGNPRSPQRRTKCKWWR